MFGLNADDAVQSYLPNHDDWQKLGRDYVSVHAPKHAESNPGLGNRYDQLSD